MVFAKINDFKKICLILNSCIKIKSKHYLIYLIQLQFFILVLWSAMILMNFTYKNIIEICRYTLWAYYFVNRDTI